MKGEQERSVRRGENRRRPRRLGVAAEQVHKELRPPSWLLLALEGRAVLEWTAWWMARPWFTRAARGDGHPVLVLPGLMAGDRSTWPLRRFLQTLGYDAHPWDEGINRGPRDGMERRLQQRIDRLADEHGTSVSLVGWSLGGVIARALAWRDPQHVRSVITLGSPLNGDPHGTNVRRVFEWASGYSADDPRLHRMRGGHPDVPVTSILSKSDGIVNWRMSLAPSGARSENIEVPASHLGLGVNPIVLWAIADRLAQPASRWQPFERSGWRKLLYRDPAQVPLEELFGG